jgi:arylsulfatase A-like enzyme
VAFVAAVTVIAGGAALYFVLGPRRARPNVILISIDSLRHDHLGCYGYGPGTSPNIDQVAREGTLFETVVSSTSWTLPAHAALFTGLPDRVHGCSDDLRWLDGSRLTLAEVLRSAGYETVGFFSGPYLSPSFGFAQGFKSYHDCTSYSDKSIALIKAGNLMSKVGQLDQDLMHLAHGDVTNPIVLREVLAWLDARPRGPFLLFIHLWDVHYDYIPPPPYDTMFDPGYKGPVDGRKLLAASRKPEGWTEADVEHLKALYDGEIRWTDDTLGKILGGIERRGLKDSSILAITADHGEAFYEHGLFGHRWTLHEEEIRIPLILRYPAAIRAGARIQRPVRIIDIAPTLLELAGAPPLPDAMGRSLAPLLGNSTAPWSDLPSLCELTVPASKIHNFAVRETALKVILNFAVNKLTVFDLLTDPKEQSPLPEGQAPLSTAALLDLYKSWARKMQDVFERLPVAGERDTPPISKMTEEQLRSLGYLK